jgi:hypothetical protein
MLTLPFKDGSEGDECISVGNSEGRGCPKDRTKFWMSVHQARIRNPELMEINPTFRKPPPILGALYHHPTIENTLRHTRACR